MTWPSGPVSTVNVDATSDNPALGVVQIQDSFNKLNLIIAHLTAFGQGLVSDPDAASALTRLGVSTYIKTLLDDPDASTALSTLGVSTYIKSLLDDPDAGTAQSTLGISTYIKTLLSNPDASTAQSTLGISAYIKSLIDDIDAATARGTLGLGNAATGNQGAGGGLNADMTDGYHASESATPSTLVARTVSGYLYASYLNQSSGDNENPPIGQIFVENTGADGYLRKASLAWLQSQLGPALSCIGNAASATKLQTARNINGVPFDGTADVTLPAGVMTPAFTSPEISMGAGGTVIQAHGLGRMPILVTATFRCKVAEANYAVGDELPLTMISNASASVPYPAVSYDATNCYFYSLAVAVAFLNKTTRAITASVNQPVNWRLIFRAW